ncbi:MAG: hypothetical protein AB1555_13695 [Nitrospirota bacterium]
MDLQTATTETLVITIVERERTLRLDQIVARLPELSWSQVFRAVDSLSRRGAIRVTRRGFDYELSPVPRRPHASSGAA